MRRNLTGGLALLFLSTALPLIAQDKGAMPAPRIIQIFRETVKPGHNAAHEKV